jgi:hypothetical protein
VWVRVPPPLLDNYLQIGTLRAASKVSIEVATDLASWLVVCCQVPAVEFGHRLGQERLLDLTGDLEFLLDAFPLMDLSNPEAPGEVADQDVPDRGEVPLSAKEMSLLLAFPPP